MQNQRRKKESDLLKKTSKFPLRQPVKEQSPDTKWIDSIQRAVKMNSYVEGCAGASDGYEEEWPHQGSCQAKYKSPYTVEKLRSEGCEDI